MNLLYILYLPTGPCRTPVTPHYPMQSPRVLTMHEAKLVKSLSAPLHRDNAEKKKPHIVGKAASVLKKQIQALETIVKNHLKEQRTRDERLKADEKPIFTYEMDSDERIFLQVENKTKLSLLSRLLISCYAFLAG